MVVKSTDPTLIIGVMGVTGSGKSNFIKVASKREDVIVGDSLKSCTKKISAYEFNANGYNFILVDTLGFNDTYKSDTEVLKELAKWLEATYRQNAKLTGIIYLHRITDVRMDGGGMRNIKMFKKLCGEDPMKNVIIASTFWAMDTLERNIAHEKELMENSDFWGDMIDHGARVARFMGDRESALKILSLFCRNRPVTLNIQRELVDKEIPLSETEAGHAVNEELAQLDSYYKKEIDSIKKETAEALAEKDAKTQRILEDQQRKLEDKLDKVHRDQALLREERRDEIRRIEAESERRYRQLKLEYEQSLGSEREASERQREHDRETIREQMHMIQQDRASFREQILYMQQNASMNDRTSFDSGGSLGGKVASTIVTGGLAIANPLLIPLAIGSLVDLINDLD